MLTWAITRAVDESRALVDQLIDQGLRAVSLPCIERTFHPVAPWRPEGHRLVLLTSVAAVEAVTPVLAASMPIDVAVLAPKTRDAFILAQPFTLSLSKGDLSPSRGATLIESSDGVVGLAHAVLESLRVRGIARASFWYPTSAAGLHTNEQNEAVTLLSPLGPVERVVAYELAVPPGLVDQLREAPTHLGVVFTSPSAVRHFVHASRQLERAPQVTCAACWGESTLRAASLHFAETCLLSRTLPLADALVALENRHV